MSPKLRTVWQPRDILVFKQMQFRPSGVGSRISMKTSAKEFKVLADARLALQSETRGVQRQTHLSFKEVLRTGWSPRSVASASDRKCFFVLLKGLLSIQKRRALF